MQRYTADLFRPFTSGLYTIECYDADYDVWIEHLNTSDLDFAASVASELTAETISARVYNYTTCEYVEI